MQESASCSADTAQLTAASR